MGYLHRITIFPIKSLDGIAVESVRIEKGKLWKDREYAFFDPDGNYLNGKRFPEILRVRARYSEDLCTVELSHPRMQTLQATLPEDMPVIASWMSAVFGFPVTMRYAPEGFQDDQKANGPTVIGTASIRSIAQWFHVPEENIRRRFRMNLEIGFNNPLDEEFLIGHSPNPHRIFQIGEVIFEAVQLCKRCSVPTRDPDTAVITPKFREQLISWRKQQSGVSLPMQNPYVLGLNTRILAGMQLYCGDTYSTDVENHKQSSRSKRQ